MIIDLTREIYSKMPRYPTHPEVKIRKYYSYSELGFAKEAISICGHSGTHVDSPSHFYPEGKTVDKIELEKLCGNAVLLNFTNKKSKETIGRKDLRKYRIAPKDIVILRTDYEKYWNEKKYMEEHTALSIDGAEFLADKKINAVGIDAPSLDPPGSKNFPVHRFLLKKEIYLIENLCNLDKISGRFKFLGFPLPLRGSTASPIRAVAFT